MEELVCPITHEVFTNPRILPCDHTFDKKSLLKLQKKECPICCKEFYLNVVYAPINWIIVNLLSLDVKEEIEKNSISAEEAKNIANTYILHVVNEKLEKLNARIKKDAEGGAYFMTTLIDSQNKNISTTILIEKVKTELTKLGYKCEETAPDYGVGKYLKISWE